MRVIAGSLRSRPLLAPDGLDTRPTADRLRETLFNILTHGAVDRVAGAAFLDLYAGSGAVGIEALSRGASSVTFVEKGPSALGVLAKNLENLKIRGTNVRVERRSVIRFLRASLEQPNPATFDVVFLDPPYDLAGEYETTLGLLGANGSSLLASGALVIAEHRRKQALAETYGRMKRARLRQQGDSSLSFYEIEPGEQ